MDAREVANKIVEAIRKDGDLGNAEVLPPELGSSSGIEIGMNVGDKHFFMTVEEG